MNNRTKVEDAFNTRIARLCKGGGFNELGDFENSTIFLIGRSGLGPKTIQDIREVLNKAGVECIEEKIVKLYRRREMILEYDRCKVKNKNPAWVETVKKELVSTY